MIREKDDMFKTYLSGMQPMRRRTERQVVTLHIQLDFLTSLFDLSSPAAFGKMANFMRNRTEPLIAQDEPPV